MPARMCPEYRLRLFMSVDLVGSTAYKAKFGHSDPKASPNPMWVDQIRHFYREFPEFLLRHYERLVDLNGSDTARGKCPVVWKTIGDEIVLCGRLVDVEHLAICIQAFLRALSSYGEYLDGAGKHLDVKGYAWVAAFPSPNVLVEVLSRRAAGEMATTSMSELPDEAVELRADLNPNEFDFLGKEIDSGFRTGRFCTADSLVMSLELAYLVARAARDQVLTGIRFSYTGRESLKGVLSDRPYPIVAIDAERSVRRMGVRQRERVVLGNGHSPEAMQIVDFLEAFMEDERVERPMLLRANEAGPLVAAPPESYLAFQANWKAADEELEQRAANEASAETAPDSTTADERPLGDLLLELNESLDKIRLNWKPVIEGIVGVPAPERAQSRKPRKPSSREG